MANEPEHPMDELLKRYSRQRLDQTDPGKEIHPATRRLLQDEVKRHYGNDQARDRKNSTHSNSGFWSLLALFWPRLGLALGVFMLLGSWIYWNLKQEADQAEFITAQKSDLPVPGKNTDKEPLSSLEDLSLAKSETAVDNLLPEDLNSAPGTPRFSEVPPPPPSPAPMISTTRESVPQPALNSTLSLTRTEPARLRAISATSELAQSRAMPLSKAMDASPAPLEEAKIQSGRFIRTQTSPVAKAVTADSTSLAGAQASSELDRNFLAKATRGADSSKDQAATKVLSQFRFLITNALVQVVDEDGSIYDGLIWPSENTSLATTSSPQSQAPIRRPLSQEEPLQEPTQPLQSETPASWRFRARGTNQTLNQLVEFRGTISSTSQIGEPTLDQPTTEGTRKPSLPGSVRIINGIFLLEERSGQFSEWTIQATEGIAPTSPLEPR